MVVDNFQEIFSGMPPSLEGSISLIEGPVGRPVLRSVNSEIITRVLLPYKSLKDHKSLMDVELYLRRYLEVRGFQDSMRLRKSDEFGSELRDKSRDKLEGVLERCFKKDLKERLLKSPEVLEFRKYFEKGEVYLLDQLHNLAAKYLLDYDSISDFERELIPIMKFPESDGKQ